MKSVLLPTDTCICFEPICTELSTTPKKVNSTKMVRFGHSTIHKPVSFGALFWWVWLEQLNFSVHLVIYKIYPYEIETVSV